MKKALALIALVAFAVSAQADLVSRSWASQIVYAYPSFNPSPSNGDGAGWLIEIALSGSQPLTTLTTGASEIDTTYGWYDGYGYTIAGFNFDAMEGDNVVMRIYNATTKGAASHYLDSSAFLLGDYEIASPDDLKVTFNFGTYASPTGAWQVIPEPATIGLFGIGAVGAWMLRRSKKAKIEA
jgi:hypothetical protein